MKLRIGYVSRNLTMSSTMRLFPAVFFAAVVTLGCAGKSAPAPNGAADPLPVQPLAAMAGRPLVILPVQHISPGDSSDWTRSQVERDEFAQLKDPSLRAAYLVIVDERIAAELTDRGLEKAWTFAPAIVSAVRRSGGIIGDPRALSATGLRRLTKPSDDPLGQPLASQIRSLAAFGDARYVLLPVELRVDNRGGLHRATLRTYLIDTRTSRIVWSGDIASAGSPMLHPGVAGSIATALADLAVPR